MSLLTRNKGALPLLMFNIFLVFVGVGLIVPVMPAYMDELGLSGSAMGILVAVFSLTQLLCSPLVGKWSDQYGRKIMVVIGMVIFSISELIFGLANSLGVLFIARLLGGMGAACITPTIMAYVADVTTLKERGTGMGLINAAISMGFIIGPGIGGFLADYGTRVPFYAAAVAGALGFILSLLILPEPLSKEKRQEARLKPSSNENLLKQFVRSYHAPYFIGLVIIFVISFGIANVETVFSLYLDHKYGFTAKEIASLVTISGILGAVAQLSIFGWLVNRFGETKVIHVCLGLASLFTVLTLFAHKYWIIMVTIFVIFLATDILRPAVSTFMSRLAGDEQGFVAGMNSSYTSLGNIVGPALAGFLFDVNVNFPYLFAAIVLFACLILSMSWGKISKRKAAHMN